MGTSMNLHTDGPCVQTINGDNNNIAFHQFITSQFIFIYQKKRLFSVLVTGSISVMAAAVVQAAELQVATVTYKPSTHFQQSFNGVAVANKARLLNPSSKILNMCCSRRRRRRRCCCCFLRPACFRFHLQMIFETFVFALQLLNHGIQERESITDDGIFVTSFITRSFGIDISAEEEEVEEEEINSPPPFAHQHL
ncbi:uncharacterized protein V6R79_012968 [Siganus canaliculatus]